MYEVVENSCAILEMSITSVLGNFALLPALPSGPGLRQRSHRAQGSGALAFKVTRHPMGAMAPDPVFS